jgi:hypothetical protein
MKEQDRASHVNFCRQFLHLGVNDRVLDVLILSREVQFHLFIYVNKHNFRYWSDNNLMQIYNKPLHSLKVTAWCDWALFFLRKTTRLLLGNSELYSITL